MEINATTIAIALLSGTIGAAFTAFLNYKIRIKILEREKLEKETKVAYVHLVQITDYVALQLLLKSSMKAFEPILNDPKDPAIPVNANFEISHGFAVVVADTLKEIEQEKLEEFSSLAKLLDPFIDSFDKLDLGIDDLANLPKLNVRHYHQFKSYAGQIQASLKIMKVAIESKNVKIIDAESIYGLWLSAKSLFEAANKLRAALIYSSRIAPSYAHEMLTEQYSELRANMQRSFINNPKLKQAAEYIKSQKEEKSNQAL